MARIACGIEYDGTAFHGWQRQGHAASIQSTVEHALSAVADQPIEVVASGRTDTGVHAAGQVIHFDTSAQRDTRAWLRGAGSHLPNTISVSWVKSVPENFHARYSAARRHYRYIILHRHCAPGLLAHRVLCTYQTLDVSRMHEAAQALLGRHDFSSFRGAGCQASEPVRTVHRLDVSEHGDFIHVDVEADGFLQHMVRILTGSLVCVGSGEKSVEWIGELLNMRDRTAGGVTMAPDGLYLVRVNYPPEFDIPPPLWTPNYSAVSPNP